MRSAYCAANDAANDKDDGDHDRHNPPSRAIPRPLRGGGLVTILQLPFLMGAGHGGAIC